MTDDIIIRVGYGYSGATFGRTGRNVPRGQRGWDPAISFTLRPVTQKGIRSDDVFEELMAEANEIGLALLDELETKIISLKAQVVAYNEQLDYRLGDGEDDYLEDIDDDMPIPYYRYQAIFDKMLCNNCRARHGVIWFPDDLSKHWGVVVRRESGMLEESIEVHNEECRGGPDKCRCKFVLEWM